MSSIKFCISEKMNSIFILDQYKENIDENFNFFKQIKEIVNDENNFYVKLIVSSSINNKDVRDFIIKKYIDKLSKNNLINDYKYIGIPLFKLTDIKGLIDSLSDSKRKIFEEYFSNIPSYFYSIYDSSDDNLNQTINDIKNRIKKNIEKFYETNKLSQDNFAFIIQNYPKIRINLEEENNAKIDRETIKKLIKILPIKYFNLEIKDEELIKILPIKYFYLEIIDEEIVNISFYFKLAKLCFLDFIIKKLYESLEQPKMNIEERAIGDILEVITVENLKNNSIEKFDQVCKVNSIWDMKYVKELDKNKVNNDNIFIIQENDDAKYIDFGFLLKGKILILVQCKKALSKIPKDYVKTSDIIKEKGNLYNSFNTYFNCKIEKIKLIYFTGIYFINKENGIYHTWSGKDNTFKVLEEITNEDNIPLVFLDFQNKKLLIKSNNNELNNCSITNIDSLIYNEEKYKFVKINDDDKSDLIKIYEGIKNQVKDQESHFINNSTIEEKLENKKDRQIYEECFSDKEINPNKKVKINTFDFSFLNYKNEDI